MLKHTTGDNRLILLREQGTCRKVAVAIARMERVVSAAIVGRKLALPAYATRHLTTLGANYYMNCDNMRVDHYQELVDRGWRR